MNSKALPRKRITLLLRLGKIKCYCKGSGTTQIAAPGQKNGIPGSKGLGGTLILLWGMEHPLHPQGALAACWMTARHVPAGDVAVATGCDFCACNATAVRDTQGDALVTSEAGGRWPRPVCHPRGLGWLPGRVPVSPLHPPRAPPHLSPSAHGSCPPGSRWSCTSLRQPEPSTMSSRAC